MKPRLDIVYCNSYNIILERNDYLDIWSHDWLKFTFNDDGVRRFEVKNRMPTLL